MAETNETIAMLEEIVADHPLHKLVLGGDFNTEFQFNSPFDNLWREFMDKHDLVCSDRLFDGSENYTYIHESLNQRKWNDHFLVSSSLLSTTSEHQIMDVGDNPSDHLPITMKISIEITDIPMESNCDYKTKVFQWNPILTI